MFPPNKHTRHHGANDKRKVHARRDAVHPRPLGSDGTGNEPVERGDGERHNGVHDAVCRGGLVAAVLVQAVLLGQCRARRRVDADGNTAWAGGSDEVHFELAYLAVSCRQVLMTRFRVMRARERTVGDVPADAGVRVIGAEVKARADGEHHG